VRKEEENKGQQSIVLGGVVDFYGFDLSHLRKEWKTTFVVECGISTKRGTWKGRILAPYKIIGGSFYCLQLSQRSEKLDPIKGEN